MNDEAAWSIKQARARLHIADLRARIADFLSAEPYTLECRRSPGRLALVLRVTQEPPPNLGAVVGDALHNLRSALDTRVVAAAEKLIGPLSEPQERALHLPTTTDLATFDGKVRAWKKPFGDSAQVLVDLVRAVQPFAPVSGYWAQRHGVPDAESERSHHHATANRLQMLAQLSNTDKHRRIHLPWWSTKDLWAWSGESDERLLFWIAPFPWTDGQEIAAVSGDHSHMTSVSLEGRLTLGLVGNDFHGGDASDVLDNIDFFVGCALEVLDFEVIRLAERPA